MELLNSLYTGFVDSESISLEGYRPKLLLNNSEKGQKILTSIIKELNQCDEFFFSVSFITQSGVLTLLNTLKDLEAKQIKGKIVASQYLNFTDPIALEKLLNFSNIELRMEVDYQLHAKGYIFRKGDTYNLIVGSSNMTQDALCKNKEWNIKVSSTNKGTLIQETLLEFEETFNHAQVVDTAWIEAYKIIYQRVQYQDIKQSDNYISESNFAYQVDTIQNIPKIMPNTMQVRALLGIEAIRVKHEKKALLISATGTGKTYLAAFDVKNFRPKRLLFLAHREQLLNQSINSFKNVLGEHIQCGKLTGKYKEVDAQYLFSSIQTVSKDAVLKQFHPDTFDYIVIDESHRVGADSYQRILNYFRPQFLLGMTATPERTDGHNVFEDFDFNIAYEIRLQEAMREEMLCPFHYFGISEINIDGEELDDESNFRYLIAQERVDNILEKAAFYGYHGNRVKGLIFCSRNDEARELSKMFNTKGLRTVALSGEHSQQERETAIERLEQDSIDNYLDYIFTVDIFNEGVDIPKINQIIMLRPTQSAIIFVQQLGRGLRKSQGKEYVVILDFIGNYKRNFMIPVALSDDRSFNKDNIRRFVVEGSKVIPGCSTVNFDTISKRKIFESIDKIRNGDIKRLIRDSYQNLKFRLGHVPYLMDFEKHDAIDVGLVFENYGSYSNFLMKHDKDEAYAYTPEQLIILEFISIKLALGKRPHELIVLKNILRGENNVIDKTLKTLRETYHLKVTHKTKVNLINVLTNKFATGTGKNTYKSCVFIEQGGDGYECSQTFKKALEDEYLRRDITELVDYGLYRYKSRYGNSYYQTSFQLNMKYSYEEVCRLLEWEENVVALNIGGYKYDEKTKTFPVFINYHKDDDIADSIKYQDRFESRKKLIAISKSKRSKSSKDVQTIYNAQAQNVAIHLFVRKDKNDEASKEFYYLGLMHAIDEPKEIVMNDSGLTAVELYYQLETEIREDVYEYITENN